MSLQNERTFRSGTGIIEELNEIPAKVSLMSFLRSSKGVSILIIIKIEHLLKEETEK